MHETIYQKQKSISYNGANQNQAIFMVQNKFIVLRPDNFFQ